MSAQRIPPIVAVCLVLALAFVPAGLAPALQAMQAAQPATSPPDASGHSHALAGARLQAAYGQLPLLFVENRGQTDPQVAFTLGGRDATVYFTPSGVTYALVEPSQNDDTLRP